MSDEVELRAAWDAVVAAVDHDGGSRDPRTAHRSAEVLDDLLGRHRQAHRRYHGVRHVVWVVRHVRALEAAIASCSGGPDTYDQTVVTAAAFFHDAVYDATRRDNEERSAVLAQHQLASMGWAAERVAFVGQLVRATATHVSDDETAAVTGPAAARGQAGLEHAVLLDADLAVLGSEPSSYAAYAAGVRAEYGHLDDHQWSLGRAAVLRRLLGRARLYGNEVARSWWEPRARANMAAELASLAPPA